MSNEAEAEQSDLNGKNPRFLEPDKEQGAATCTDESSIISKETKDKILNIVVGEVDSSEGDIFIVTPDRALTPSSDNSDDLNSSQHLRDKVEAIELQSWQDESTTPEGNNTTHVDTYMSEHRDISVGDSQTTENQLAIIHEKPASETVDTIAGLKGQSEEASGDQVSDKNQDNPTLRIEEKKSNAIEDEIMGKNNDCITIVTEKGLEKADEIITPRDDELLGKEHPEISQKDPNIQSDPVISRSNEDTCNLACDGNSFLTEVANQSSKESFSIEDHNAKDDKAQDRDGFEEHCKVLESLDTVDNEAMVHSTNETHPLPINDTTVGESVRDKEVTSREIDSNLIEEEVVDTNIVSTCEQVRHEADLEIAEKEDLQAHQVETFERPSTYIPEALREQKDELKYEDITEDANMIDEHCEKKKIETMPDTETSIDINETREGDESTLTEPSEQQHADSLPSVDSTENSEQMKDEGASGPEEKFDEKGDRLEGSYKVVSEESEDVEGDMNAKGEKSLDMEEVPRDNDQMYSRNDENAETNLDYQISASNNNGKTKEENQKANKDLDDAHTSDNFVAKQAEFSSEDSGEPVPETISDIEQSSETENTSQILPAVEISGDPFNKKEAAVDPLIERYDLKKEDIQEVEDLEGTNEEIIKINAHGIQLEEDPLEKQCEMVTDETTVGQTVVPSDNQLDEAIHMMRHDVNEENELHAKEISNEGILGDESTKIVISENDEYEHKQETEQDHIHAQPVHDISIAESVQDQEIASKDIMINRCVIEQKVDDENSDVNCEQARLEADSETGGTKEDSHAKTEALDVNEVSTERVSSDDPDVLHAQKDGLVQEDIIKDVNKIQKDCKESNIEGIPDTEASTERNESNEDDEVSKQQQALEISKVDSTKTSEPMNDEGASGPIVKFEETIDKLEEESTDGISVGEVNKSDTVAEGDMPQENSVTMEDKTQEINKVGKIHDESAKEIHEHQNTFSNNIGMEAEEENEKANEDSGDVCSSDNLVAKPGIFSSEDSDDVPLDSTNDIKEGLETEAAAEKTSHILPQDHNDTFGNNENSDADTTQEAFDTKEATSSSPPKETYDTKNEDTQEAAEPEETDKGIMERNEHDVQVKEAAHEVACEMFPDEATLSNINVQTIIPSDDQPVETSILNLNDEQTERHNNNDENKTGSTRICDKGIKENESNEIQNGISENDTHRNKKQNLQDHSYDLPINDEEVASRDIETDSTLTEEIEDKSSDAPNAMVKNETSSKAEGTNAEDIQEITEVHDITISHEEKGQQDALSEMVATDNAEVLQVQKDELEHEDNVEDANKIEKLQEKDRTKDVFDAEASTGTNETNEGDGSPFAEASDQQLASGLSSVDSKIDTDQLGDEEASAPRENFEEMRGKLDGSTTDLLVEGEINEGKIAEEEEVLCQSSVSTNDIPGDNDKLYNNDKDAKEMHECQNKTYEGNDLTLSGASDQQHASGLPSTDSKNDTDQLTHEEASGPGEKIEEMSEKIDDSSNEISVAGEVTERVMVAEEEMLQESSVNTDNVPHKNNELSTHNDKDAKEIHEFQNETNEGDDTTLSGASDPQHASGLSSVDSENDTDQLNDEGDAGPGERFEETSNKLDDASNEISIEGELTENVMVSEEMLQESSVNPDSVPQDDKMYNNEDIDAKEIHEYQNETTGSKDLTSCGASNQQHAYGLPSTVSKNDTDQLADEGASGPGEKIEETSEKMDDSSNNTSEEGEVIESVMMAEGEMLQESSVNTDDVLQDNDKDTKEIFEYQNSISGNISKEAEDENTKVNQDSGHMCSSENFVAKPGVLSYVDSDDAVLESVNDIKQGDPLNMKEATADRLTQTFDSNNEDTQESAELEEANEKIIKSIEHDVQVKGEELESTCDLITKEEELSDIITERNVPSDDPGEAEPGINMVEKQHQRHNFEEENELKAKGISEEGIPENEIQEILNGISENDEHKNKQENVQDRPQELPIHDTSAGETIQDPELASKNIEIDGKLIAQVEEKSSNVPDAQIWNETKLETEVTKANYIDLRHGEPSQHKGILSERVAADNPEVLLVQKDELEHNSEAPASRNEASKGEDISSTDASEQQHGPALSSFGTKMGSDQMSEGASMPEEKNEMGVELEGSYNDISIECQKAEIVTAAEGNIHQESSINTESGPQDNDKMYHSIDETVGSTHKYLGSEAINMSNKAEDTKEKTRDDSQDFPVSDKFIAESGQIHSEDTVGADNNNINPIKKDIGIEEDENHDAITSNEETNVEILADAFTSKEEAINSLFQTYDSRSEGTRESAEVEESNKNTTVINADCEQVKEELRETAIEIVANEVANEKNRVLTDQRCEQTDEEAPVMNSPKENVSVDSFDTKIAADPQDQTYNDVNENEREHAEQEENDDNSIERNVHHDQVKEEASSETVNIQEDLSNINVATIDPTDDQTDEAVQVISLQEEQIESQNFEKENQTEATETSEDLVQGNDPKEIITGALENNEYEEKPKMEEILENITTTCEAAASIKESDSEEILPIRQEGHLNEQKELKDADKVNLEANEYVAMISTENSEGNTHELKEILDGELDNNKHKDKPEVSHEEVSECVTTCEGESSNVEDILKYDPSEKQEERCQAKKEDAFVEVIDAHLTSQKEIAKTSDETSGGGTINICQNNELEVALDIAQENAKHKENSTISFNENSEYACATEEVASSKAGDSDEGPIANQEELEMQESCEKVDEAVLTCDEATYERSIQNSQEDSCMISDANESNKSLDVVEHNNKNKDESEISSTEIPPDTTETDEGALTNEYISEEGDLAQLEKTVQMKQDSFEEVPDAVLPTSTVASEDSTNNIYQAKASNETTNDIKDIDKAEIFSNVNETINIINEKDMHNDKAEITSNEILENINVPNKCASIRTNTEEGSPEKQESLEEINEDILSSTCDQASVTTIADSISILNVKEGQNNPMHDDKQVEDTEVNYGEFIVIEAGDISNTNNSDNETPVDCTSNKHEEFCNLDESIDVIPVVTDVPKEEVQTAGLVLGDDKHSAYYNRSLTKQDPESQNAEEVSSTVAMEQHNEKIADGEIIIDESGEDTGTEKDTGTLSSAEKLVEDSIGKVDGIEITEESIYEDSTENINTASDIYVHAVAENDSTGTSKKVKDNSGDEKVNEILATEKLEEKKEEEENKNEVREEEQEDLNVVSKASQIDENKEDISTTTIKDDEGQKTEASDVTDKDDDYIDSKYKEGASMAIQKEPAVGEFDYKAASANLTESQVEHVNKADQVVSTENLNQEDEEATEHTEESEISPVQNTRNQEGIAWGAMSNELIHVIVTETGGEPTVEPVSVISLDRSLEDGEKSQKVCIEEKEETTEQKDEEEPIAETSFKVLDHESSEIKKDHQTDLEDLPVSRYLMDHILQKDGPNLDKGCNVESKEILGNESISDEFHKNSTSEDESNLKLKPAVQVMEDPSLSESKCSLKPEDLELHTSTEDMLAEHYPSSESNLCEKPEASLSKDFKDEVSTLSSDLLAHAVPNKNRESEIEESVEVMAAIDNEDAKKPNHVHDDQIPSNAQLLTESTMQEDNADLKEETNVSLGVSEKVISSKEVREEGLESPEVVEDSSETSSAILKAPKDKGSLKPGDLDLCTVTKDTLTEHCPNSDSNFCEKPEASLSKDFKDEVSSLSSDLLAHAVPNKNRESEREESVELMAAIDIEDAKKPNQVHDDQMASNVSQLLTESTMQEDNENLKEEINVSLGVSEKVISSEEVREEGLESPEVVEDGSETSSAILKAPEDKGSLKPGDLDLHTITEDTLTEHYPSSESNLCEKPAASLSKDFKDEVSSLSSELLAHAVPSKDMESEIEESQEIMGIIDIESGKKPDHEHDDQMPSTVSQMITESTLQEDNGDLKEEIDVSFVSSASDKRISSKKSREEGLKSTEVVEDNIETPATILAEKAQPTSETNVHANFPTTAEACLLNTPVGDLKNESQYSESNIHELPAIVSAGKDFKDEFSNLSSELPPHSVPRKITKSEIAEPLNNVSAIALEDSTKSDQEQDILCFDSSQKLTESILQEDDGILNKDINVLPISEAFAKNNLPKEKEETFKAVEAVEEIDETTFASTTENTPPTFETDGDAKVLKATQSHTNAPDQAIKNSSKIQEVRDMEEPEERIAESKINVKRNLDEEFKACDSGKTRQFEANKNQIVELDEQNSEVKDPTVDLLQKPIIETKDYHVEEVKLDDHKDVDKEQDEHEAEGDKHQLDETKDAKDADPKSAHKKSHNILSGVGSKVKNSIAKVKKAITGKSSHSKTVSPK